MSDQPVSTLLSPEEIERYLQQKEYRRNYNKMYREAHKPYFAQKQREQRERRTRINSARTDENPDDQSKRCELN